MLTWFSVLALLFQAHSTPSEPADTVSARATPEAVIVVELFTSQGCPLCPAANQLLAEYGAREDVIALAWGVNYWDAYGWTDQFAMPEFIDRQKAYVDAGEAMRVYTPHFVINGSPEQLRFDPERVTEALTDSAHLSAAHISLTEDGDRVLALEGARTGPAEIWLVQYMPGVEERLIESGRNAGLRMTHFNMVRSVEKLDDWSGGAAIYALPEPEAGLDAVVLVQDGPGGRILSAARLP